MIFKWSLTCSNFKSTLNVLDQVIENAFYLKFYNSFTFNKFSLSIKWKPGFEITTSKWSLIVQINFQATAISYIC